MSLAVEEAVLGCAMLESSVIPNCELLPGDFVFPQHRSAWGGILRLFDQRQSTDALSLAELMYADQAPIPKGGWLEYLSKICHNTASTKNAKGFAQALKKESLLRSAHAIGKRIESVDEIDQIDIVIRELIELVASKKANTCHIQEAMSEAIELMDSDAVGIPTGLMDLDSCLGGLHNEDLIIVGARPAAGKTAYMLNLALASTFPVGLISGEQGRGQIGMRTIAIDKLVNLHRMRTGQLDDMEWARINDAINAAKAKNIWIFDKPAPSIDDVVRQARQWKYEKNIGILMVDYLQKLTGGAGENFRLQVGDTVGRLKDLARELKIPIVVLAQVKREIESRPMQQDGLGRMPYAGDIAESGIIEQEADVVMTLYRPEVYDENPAYKGIAYVNICKNRHGPVGYKRVSWRGEYLKFGDLANYETKDRWNAA